MENKRLDYVDALKSFGIFLVIWGHAIVQLGGNPVNYTYLVIYSFHMPLFFIISGFFFKSSLKLKPKDFLIKKGFQLLYPWLIWCLIVAVFQLATHQLDNHNYYQKGVLIFNRWFWFLRSLLLSYVLAYFAYKIFKKGYLVAIFGILFVLFAPFFKIQSFYFPLFLLGIWLKENYSLICKHLNTILYLAFFTFVCSLFFLNGSHLTAYPGFFSYETYSYEIPNLSLPLFRGLIGIAGSLFFFALFQKTWKTNRFYSYLQQRGRYTLGIYLLQTLVVENIFPQLLSFQYMNKWVYALLIAPVLSLALFEIFTIMMKWLEKRKILVKILFGNAYS